MGTNKVEKPADFRVCLNVGVTEYRSLPVCSAVYIVFDPPNDVLYIGKSRQLKQRWANSRAHTWFKPVTKLRIAWFPTPEEHLNKTETALIQAYDPMYNIRQRRR